MISNGFKKKNSEKVCGTRDPPPPFMEKTILIFNIVFLIISLRGGGGGGEGGGYSMVHNGDDLLTTFSVSLNCKICFRPYGIHPYIQIETWDTKTTAQQIQLQEAVSPG